MANRFKAAIGGIRASRMLLFSFAFISTAAIGSSNAQSIKTDPGHKEYVEVGGIRFSCPNHFTVRQEKSYNEFAYMRHDEYDLRLIVAVPGKSIDDEYIRKLAALVLADLYPDQRTTYTWKRLKDYEKVSRFEVGGGKVQGFNGQQRVIMQYRVLKIQGKEVVIGYVFGLDGGESARVLFERNLGGDSMPGWYAQARIIASITGEKYDKLNPPDLPSGIAAPPPAMKKP